MFISFSLMKTVSNIVENKVKPHFQSVEVGQSARFVCSTAGEEVLWTFKMGNALPFNAITDEINDDDGQHRITIFQAQLPNSGEYECHGTDENNNEIVAVGELLVVSCKYCVY